MILGCWLVKVGEVLVISIFGVDDGLWLFVKVGDFYFMVIGYVEVVYDWVVILVFVVLGIW